MDNLYEEGRVMDYSTLKDFKRSINQGTSSWRLT